MRNLLIVAFGACLLAAGRGEAAVGPAGGEPAGKPLRCSVWYEDCYFCDGPTYEYVCERRCIVCPNSEIVCEPTGWTCGGRSSVPVRGRKSAASPALPWTDGGCSARLGG